VASALIEAANAGRTVLVPNTEFAAALFDAIERAHRDAGRDIWPTPRVRDFGGWLKERHVQRQLTDSTTPRCLSDVEERELWRSVVLEGDSSRQFLEPSGAARAVRRAHRAMFEYGIPLSAVAASRTEESLALLEWHRRFTERCRLLHCISSAQLPPSPPDEAIAWIESPQWRPVARRWLEENAGAALPPMSAAARGSLRLHRAESAGAELAAMARWGQINLRDIPRFRAWICVPDLPLRREELVDAFDAALAPERFSLSDPQDGAPYAVAGGTPLADYAPVRSALALLSAGSGPVAFEQFSALLRLPELQVEPAEAGAAARAASAAARLDVALRSRAPSEADLGQWLTLADAVAHAQAIGPVAALLRLQSAARALDELRGNQPISRWVSLWITAFEAGPWALRHRWSSSEYQSAERFRELLAALASGDRVFGTHSRPSAERILRRAARDTAFQTQTGVPAIWVSGQLLDPWLAYDGLWITGCSEERWPPPPDPIPLLPIQLQRQYGVTAAAVQSQLQFAEDLQQRWQVRARDCVFSCADAGDGRRAAPSPLLPQTAGPLPPECSATPQPHWLALSSSAPVLEEFVDETAPPFGCGERTRGVSTLRAQSRCAFRGFAQTRLMSDVLERPVPGFNERERGEMLHDALEHIWSEVRDSTRLLALESDPAGESRLVDDGALRAIAKLCRRRDPGSRWRDRERPRMQALLTKWLQLERRREPFEVERLEEGAQSAWHAGLEFSVRIDRTDRLADGARVLIDYKSGMAAPDWRGARPDNPQLPIYALLRRDALAAVAYGRINAAGCSFVAESERAGIFGAGSAITKMEGEPAMAALVEIWSRRIEKLAADFKSGHAAVDPTPEACRSCHLHGLCRIPSALDDTGNGDG
jgi:ATP-dependent helicase/nuclease subunit B